jgi:hypothetical protein
MRKSIQVLSLLLSVIILSCSKQKEEYKINYKVEDVAKKLSKDTLMYGFSAGNDFDELMKIATDEDLLFLTNHKSAIVRCYAFKGLEIRNNSEIRNVFFNHLNDTIDIVQING